MRAIGVEENNGKNIKRSLPSSLLDVFCFKRELSLETTYFELPLAKISPLSIDILLSCSASNIFAALINLRPATGSRFPFIAFSSAATSAARKSLDVLNIILDELIGMMLAPLNLTPRAVTPGRCIPILIR